MSSDTMTIVNGVLAGECDAAVTNERRAICGSVPQLSALRRYPPPVAGHQVEKKGHPPSP